MVSDAFFCHTLPSLYRSVWVGMERITVFCNGGGHRPRRPKLCTFQRSSGLAFNHLLQNNLSSWNVLPGKSIFGYQSPEPHQTVYANDVTYVERLVLYASELSLMDFGLSCINLTSSVAGNWVSENLKTMNPKPWMILPD